MAGGGSGAGGVGSATGDRTAGGALGVGATGVGATGGGAVVSAESHAAAVSVVPHARSAARPRRTRGSGAGRVARKADDVGAAQKGQASSVARM
jgi:hypothetical protein